MSRFKKFLATAGGMMLASAASAQGPVVGDPAPGIGGGTVVSVGPAVPAPATLAAPVAPGPIPVMTATPVPGQMSYTTGPAPVGPALTGPLMNGPLTTAQMLVPPSTTGLVPGAVPGTWVQSPVANMYGTNCCGPVGAHGPVGYETYFRVGVNVPFGDGLLAEAMNPGVMLVAGSKSLFFDQTGTSAFVVDPHITMTYNNAGPSPLGFLQARPGGIPFGPEEIVTVRNVLRYSVGLGFGHDWYAMVPGFVGGQWDAFTSSGIDAGGRWGTGHVDYQPITEPQGYRRTHDVFGQAYLGAHMDFNLPCGAWTFVAGGRAELAYTFSDLSPTGGSFWEVNVLATVGFRF